MRQSPARRPLPGSVRLLGRAAVPSGRPEAAAAGLRAAASGAAARPGARSRSRGRRRAGRRITGSPRSFSFTTITPGVMEIGPLRVTAAHMNHPVETFGFRLEHRGQVPGLLGRHRPVRRAGRAGPRRGRAALRGVVRRAGRRRRGAACPRTCTSPGGRRASTPRGPASGQLVLTHLVPWNDQEHGRWTRPARPLPARSPSPRQDSASCSTEHGS